MDVYQRRRLVALSALAAVFIIAVVLIGSCGDDEEEAPITPLSGATGGAGPTELSRDDYAQEADAICLDSNTLLAEAEAEADPSSGEPGEIVAGQLESSSGFAFDFVRFHPATS